MREREEPITQIMKASDARAQFSQVLNQVFRRQKRVVVEKSGIPVAVIVSADDFEQLQRLKRRQDDRFKALDRFAEPFKDERPEDIEREVAKAVEAARAQLRTKAKQPTQHR